MKAILIDVRNKCVQEVDVPDSLDDIYKVLECHIITCAYFNTDISESLYVDDEALLKRPDELPGAFRISLYPSQPLFGHGLVVNHNEEGERIDVTLTVSQVAEMVTFLSEEELRMFHAVLSSTPPSFTFF